MDKKMNAIQDEAKSLFAYTRDIRRDLHRNPELGFEEVRTSGIIIRELTSLGIEVQTGIGKTGVVGLIPGGGPGPVVLLRFDMDALPVTEENAVEYASQVKGKMHACGHDGHVAIGLTVANILSRHRDRLHGTIKLVFQPAEEGLGGAEAMIKDGLLENPVPEIAYALHLWNDRPVGWVGIAPGAVMAASDIFKIKIKGKGGHGAFPHQTIDPIVTAAQVVSGIQTLVSRNVSPLQSAVVSVTRIAGGETFNVIPPSVDLQGTIRTFDTGVRQTVINRFGRLVENICQSMDCEVDTSIDILTPALNNNPKITGQLHTLFHELFPGDTLDSSYRTMGSEDMAYVLQKIPGCYFFVGSANSGKGLDYGHHHPRFNFDEQVLPKAITLIAMAALNLPA
jgi:amidohydrolase